jgi:hypothetical protein
MTKEKMEETQDLMVKYYGSEESVTVSETFTNDYLA